jgi:hypothetical protein
MMSCTTVHCSCIRRQCYGTILAGLGVTRPHFVGPPASGPGPGPTASGMAELDLEFGWGLNAQALPISTLLEP